jgi:hypothetical protein
MAYQVDIHATRYHRRARRRRRQVPTEEGGDNRGLKAYQAVLPNRQPLHRRRSEPPGRSEEGGG